MTKILTNEQNYYDIADTIRQMKNVNTTYKPREMASALKDIYSNEVEGVPPLSFESNGMPLIDYRIDGANGGVGDRTSNLFDYSTVTTGYRITWSTGMSVADNSAIMSDFIAVSNGIYRANVSVNLIGYDINKNYIGTYDPNNKIFRKDYSSKTTYYDIADNNVKFVKLLSYSATDTISQDTMFYLGSTIPKYEPYGYKVPVVVSGKNLLQNTAATQTINGVTFTVNEDKSIVANGTATSSVNLYINSNLELDAGEYYLSCECEGEFTAKPLIIAMNFGNYTYTIVNNQVNLSVTEKNGKVVLQVANGTTINAILYPMIRKTDIADNTYEPYIEPTTTNIYLDEPIEGKANIPSEYTEVEYIESTGTQYINTNYTPVQGDDLEFKNVTINTFNGALFSAGTENYQLILLGSGSLCYYKYFQAGNAVQISFSTITNGNIKVLNGNLYINNVLKAKADYGGAVNTTLNIFRRANNISNLIGKIGEIIISNNGIIKRNFIPCYRKSDNVAGLYDLVNNTFYTNQGTGNFIVGPIKENESISLSDTNVNIPTIEGTNVLTIDTTAQPSNVYIQAPKDPDEIVDLTTILEEEI